MTEFLILVTGKDFKIEPSDSFEVQLYLDENDIPCFKSVSWKKLQGGLPFQQNSILPGDQLLCKSFYEVIRGQNLTVEFMSRESYDMRIVRIQSPEGHILVMNWKVAYCQKYLFWITTTWNIA